MAHQPFNDWMFDEKNLNDPQRTALMDHLALCSDCRRLHDNWQDIHQLMQKTREVEPQPGFGQRWRLSLGQRRAAEQQRLQSFRLLAWLGGWAGLVLLILGATVLAAASRINLIAVVIHTGVQGAVLVSETMALLGKVPTSLVVVGWISLTTSLLGLAGIWLISLWKVSVRGGTRI